MNAQEECRTKAPFVLAAVAAAAVMMLFMPWNADGCFAVNDALWYAHAAENEGLASISGHHPLFHLLLLPLTGVLESVGIPHPGHCAARIVCGAAFALIVILIGHLSGWRRGALVLVPLLLATRGVLLDGSVGETVVPAAALALWALVTAVNPSVSLLRAGTALVLALLLRQDNILIVPGVVVAMLAARGVHQWRRTTLWLFLCGLATIAGYLLCWKLSGTSSLSHFLFSTAQNANRTWAPNALPGAEALLLRCLTLGVAVTGVQSDFRAFGLMLGLGAAFLTILGLGAALARGSSGVLRGLWSGVLLCSALRFVFYWWFEPQNYEWWIADLVFAVALAAGTLRGAPPHSTWRTALGLGLLLGMAAAVFASHASSTFALRDTTLHDAAAQAEEWSKAPEAPIVLTHGFRPHTALHLRRVPHDAAVLAATPSAEVAGPILTDLIARSGKVVVVLIDRFVGDGHPAQALTGSDSLGFWLDATPEVPPARTWRQRGKVQVLWLPPLPR